METAAAAPAEIASTSSSRRRRARRFASAISGSSDRGKGEACSVIAPVSLAPRRPVKDWLRGHSGTLTQVTVLSPVAYNAIVRRVLAYGILVVLSASALAACGGSGHFTPAEQAAIDAVQRKDNLLRIFPDRPGTIGCRILVSGAVRGYAAGHCTTHASTRRQRIRLDFTEQTLHIGTGRFTLILDKHNRIVSQHWHGDVPQMRN